MYASYFKKYNLFFLQIKVMLFYASQNIQDSSLIFWLFYHPN